MAASLSSSRLRRPGIGAPSVSPLRPHYRWGGFKTLRERWLAHLETTRNRAVLLVEPLTGQPPGR